MTFRLPWPEDIKPLLQEARELSPAPCYVVGGSLRDLLVGRAVKDLDLACSGAEKLARRLSRKLKASFIVLDEANAVFRVVLGPEFRLLRQIDVAEIQASSINEDLLRRDFTINALAFSINDGTLLDPRNGLQDIKRKLVRTERESILREDPLRILRAFRIAAQIQFKIESGTLKKIAAAARLASKPAGERIQSELLALLEAPGSPAWLKIMDKAGVLCALFKELSPSRDCAVQYYGKGGVLKHALKTAERADFLLENLKAVFPSQGDLIESRFGESEGFPKRRALIILAALLHDVSKPETARIVNGRLHFFGHDKRGSKKVADILKRLRFSRDQIRLIQAAVLHHLRPGYLAEAPKITERAVYRFFRDTGEEALDVLLSSWADHASYLSRKRLEGLLPFIHKAPGEDLAALPAPVRKTLKHLQTVSFLMRRIFNAEQKAVPRPFLDGHDVMKILKIPPGPPVGVWLEKIREAQAVGKIQSRAEALEFLGKK